MYDKPFHITEPVSNNAFSYEKRQNKRLFVPSLIEGDFSDIALGREIVFEDFDDEGVLRSCTGLRNFVRIGGRFGGPPVYVFDNHNHAFAFWHLEAFRGLLANGALLVHMDRHKDSREPEKFLSAREARDADAVSLYTNSVLNVGNFIPAAFETGLAGNVINLDSEQSMKEFDPAILKTGNVIFDLDLDIFAPEMDYLDDGLKMRTIKAAAEFSSIITVATSPFFIGQTLAIACLRRLEGVFHKA